MRGHVSCSRQSQSISSTWTREDAARRTGETPSTILVKWCAADVLPSKRVEYPLGVPTLRKNLVESAHCRIVARGRQAAAIDVVTETSHEGESQSNGAAECAVRDGKCNFHNPWCGKCIQASVLTLDGGVRGRMITDGLTADHRWKGLEEATAATRRVHLVSVGREARWTSGRQALSLSQLRGQGGLYIGTGASEECDGAGGRTP